MVTGDDLRRYVENNPGLVSVKETPDGLKILKYKKKVFYKNLWDEYLELCRGTIVDRDFNVVQLPFTKIYNFGVEDRSPVIHDEEVVLAYRKVNGFMASVTWHNDQLLVSTTGSVDSDFVDYIKDSIDETVYEDVCKDNPEYTFLFECVHPDDPHIIKEKAGMHLLAVREKAWGSSEIVDPAWLHSLSKKFSCEVPKFHQLQFGCVKKIVKNVKHEGFVVYASNNRVTKIKSPYYLTAKFLARIKNPMKLVDEDVKQRVDEEFYPLVDYIKENIDEFTSKTEQDRLVLVRDFLKNYKK